MLTADGEWRKTRLFRSHEQAKLVGRARGHADDVRGERVGVNVDETERAELIAALHQAATFAEALLDLNTRLLDALTRGENLPDSQELDYLRAGLSRWREQLATLRQRIHGLTAEPPQRMQ